MINLLASILVWLTGLYLISFALVMLLAPDRAKRFLRGFARPAFTHYLELGLRLIAGVAILLDAPRMLFSNFFVICGWILVVTTVGLFAVPWQWHQPVLHSFSGHSSWHPLFLAELNNGAGRLTNWQTL